VPSRFAASPVVSYFGLSMGARYNLSTILSTPLGDSLSLYCISLLFVLT
jgi:hypothetical protein